MSLALLVAALGCTLMGGFFFAFSVCVMRALSLQPPPHGIAAMQSINVVVLNPVFLALFLGLAALAAVLAAVALWRPSAGVAPFIVAGALLYVVGSFGVTMALNVPLNNALAAVRPDSAEGAHLWTHYLEVWTRWNHVRLLASLLAGAAFAWAFAR